MVVNGVSSPKVTIDHVWGLYSLLVFLTSFLEFAASLICSQHPLPHPCVNKISFHLSCSPASLTSGLEIMIACCTMTLPATAFQSPTHTSILASGPLPPLLCLSIPHSCLLPLALPLVPPLTSVLFTICRCRSASPLIFQYNVDEGWWTQRIE